MAKKSVVKTSYTDPISGKRVYNGPKQGWTKEKHRLTHPKSRLKFFDEIKNMPAYILRAKLKKLPTPLIKVIESYLE